MPHWHRALSWELAGWMVPSSARTAKFSASQSNGNTAATWSRQPSHPRPVRKFCTSTTRSKPGSSGSRSGPVWKASSEPHHLVNIWLAK